jgi:hypothetical protein
MHIQIVRFTRLAHALLLPITSHSRLHQTRTQPVAPPQRRRADHQHKHKRDRDEDDLDPPEGLGRDKLGAVDEGGMAAALPTAESGREGCDARQPEDPAAKCQRGSDGAD